MYEAYVTTIKNIRKHNNADRLQIATIFGNSVIVDLSYYAGQKVIFFPVDGQLSAQFANENNLIRKKDENGNNIGGYLDPNKRNITALRLRGEKSEGLVLPIEVLAKYTDVSMLHDGDKITMLNGCEICRKYVPVIKGNNRGTIGNKTRKTHANLVPLFIEHADTEQLAYNLDVFKPGDEVEITLKMHGTSGRTSYLPILSGYSDSAKMNLRNKIEKAICKITNKPFEPKHDGVPTYKYGYISGTRRTVLNDWDGGYYGSNQFRKKYHDFFKGKLHKNEEIYYEIVGFIDNGTPIMASADNKKVGDKEFVRQYGKTTVFSYGCDPYGKNGMPQNDIYVYRMTITNEDGDIVEYPPDFMRYRCEQMGVKCVPVLHRFIIPAYIQPSYDTASITEVNAGEYVKHEAQRLYDGADPVDSRHIREGVVVRITNKPKFCAYKHKNFNFKCLSGIAVASMTEKQLEGLDEDILSEL